MKHKKRKNLSKNIQELVEGLRKAILWAECCSSRIKGDERDNINWTYLNDARKILNKYMEEC